jgi:hypothetical protein
MQECTDRSEKSAFRPRGAVILAMQGVVGKDGK